MKNTLAENMLRFGTKNLSGAAKEIMLITTIMETINQHGLGNVIKQRLSEQASPVYGQGTIPLKPVQYIVNNTHGAYQQSKSGSSEPNRFAIIPKGTIFKVDPKNPNVATATILVATKWKTGAMPAGSVATDIIDPAKQGIIISAGDFIQKVNVSWSADWPTSLAVQNSIGISYQFGENLKSALVKAFSTTAQ